MNDSSAPLKGGCTCGSVRYRLLRGPMFVHCCHCRWCQRETGSAFALNAMIESRELELARGRPDLVATPSNSGKGQRIARCPHCRIALWSHYAGAGGAVSFVRVGTLDEADRLPPDPHLHRFQAALAGGEPGTPAPAAGARLMNPAGSMRRAGAPAARMPAQRQPERGLQTPRRGATERHAQAAP